MDTINAIEQKLKVRLIISMFLCTVLCVGVMIYVQILVSDSILFLWFKGRRDIFGTLFLATAFICILYYYWRTPWNYLREVISATRIVFDKGNKSIVLSEPLHEVENQMNQIKLTLAMSNQAIEQAEMKKDELVMYLAHDIRTPLTSVIGYLNLLNEATDMPQEQRKKYTQIALEKSERLEILINELFEVTRYHTQTVAIKKNVFNLQYLLTQVVDEIRPILSANGNEVNIAVEDSLIISGDAEKLARVFGNLLKNAASYSDPNTEIRISAKNIEEYTVITFQNQGETISPEDLAVMFEKFNRLDKARASKTGGVGLGLAIAKEIIVLHGGEITVASDDKTVSFVIRLPRAN